MREPGEPRQRQIWLIRAGTIRAMDKRGGYSGSAPKVAPKPPDMPGASSNAPAQPKPQP